MDQVAKAIQFIMTKTGCRVLLEPIPTTTEAEPISTPEPEIEIEREVLPVETFVCVNDFAQMAGIHMTSVYDAVRVGRIPASSVIKRNHRIEINTKELATYKPKSKGYRVPVRCIELDTIFPSMKMAAKGLKISCCSIHNSAATGKITKGYHFEFVK